MTTERLDAFRASLKINLTGRDNRSHPFMCDGSPLDCKLFVVGLNAATKLSRPFWTYWDQSGLQKKKFIEDYVAQRGHLRGARRRIELIADGVGYQRTLDTNIYFHSTRTAKELRRIHKDHRVFEFIFKGIKPKIMLAHGRQAVQFFRERCPDFIEDTECPQKVTFQGFVVDLLCSPHLCLVSIERTKKIAAILAGALANQCIRQP